MHRSFVVVRGDSNFLELEDLRGTVFAMNEPDSNSGMNLPRRLFAPLQREGRFFGERVVSGSHEASIEHVVAGRADTAAVDCVTFALLRRYRPDALANVRIIAETPPSPAPPFATSARIDESIHAVLRESLTDVARNRELCDSLLIGAVELADESAYGIVLQYEREAEALGYPILA